MKHRGEAGTPSTSILASFLSLPVLLSGLGWLQSKGPIGPLPCLILRDPSQHPDPPLGLGTSWWVSVSN